MTLALSFDFSNKEVGLFDEESFPIGALVATALVSLQWKRLMLPFDSPSTRKSSMLNIRCHTDTAVVHFSMYFAFCTFLFDAAYMNVLVDICTVLNHTGCI